MAFWKKNKGVDRRINQDNSVEVPVYGPHDLLCAQDYRLPQMFAEFEKNFEVRCKAWLRNATPDMYNTGYMDMLVDKMEQEGLVSLDIQEVDHQSVIYELGKVWIGDLIKAEKKLSETISEKKAVETELSQLESIYHKGTAYEAFHKRVVEEAV